MAELLPLNFTIPAEMNIASYSWIDLASGTGYIPFYCMHTYPNANILTTNSDMHSTPASDASTVTGTVLERTFNTTLKMPRVISGTAYMDIYVSRTAWGGGANWVFDIVVKKNGVAIGTMASQTITDAIDPNLNQWFNGSIVIPETVFGAGDVLGVYVKVYWTEGTSGSCYVTYDPSSATRMAIDIPFRIQN